MLNSYPLSGAFIFYSPLDVVSGDFFWFTRKDDYAIICCADCTGHGVPGAFMSMIASTILTGICDNLKTFQIDPSDILEKLDSSLIENLSHNRSQTGAAKDGCDISIAVINMLNHTLMTASAKRPVLIIKDGQLTTIKGTKRSIGDIEPFIRERAFTTTTMQLSKGDTVYMYTDGYSDQFGGQTGEKLKNTKIEKVVKSIYADDMDEQSLTIQELFTQWKADYPQTDDVLFIGIKI